MCGITGIFDSRGRSQINSTLLEAMNHAQFHRGPDAGAIFCEPGVGLGHRRLAIIDVAGSPQPMATPDGQLVIVYNGEIYNFQEIRNTLTAAGHKFLTDGDTEVILFAWREWGADCVRRFRGMFAFALWDASQQTLFMARDRLGIKPLYWTALPNGLVLFGSELKSLLAYRELPREIDPQATEEYFAYGYVPEPKTILKNVQKLSPAHTLTIRRGEPIAAERAYWNVPFEAHHPVLSEADAIEGLVERIRDAVSVRLISEVPLGAFLSGGVDSSAVVAMMAGLNDDPVKTCSISFGDPRFNEAEFAAQVAQRYQTDHEVAQVDPDNFDLLDRLGGLYDEPYADSSALPTYRVCELARRKVTVALSGDGGDENLAGYRRYRWFKAEANMRAMLPHSVRRPLFGTLGHLYPKADWAPRVFRAKTTFEALAKDNVAGYFHAVSLLREPLRGQLYSSRLRHELAGYDALQVLRRHAENAPTDDPLSLVQYLDMKTYLPGDILTKVDRASMAHSLEVRVPLLDHPLTEWISGLPPTMKLNGSEGKYLFKKALEPHLPNDILYRPKMGFSVPLASWFRGPLRERVKTAVLGSTLADTDLFDMGLISRLVNQHQSGQRDHSAPLWSILMFENFVRRVMS